MINFHFTRHSLVRGMMLLTGSALLAACVTPQRVTTTSAIQNAPVSIAGKAENAEWPATEWWKQYHDDTLNALIEQALKSAPTLASAEARFEIAQANVHLADADGLHVDASADASRQRLSDNGLFSPKFLGFNWYNQADLGLHGSYAFDWWHKRKNNVSAALDDAHSAQAQRDAITMSLSASVAQSYFGWQADQEQISILLQQQQLAEKRRDIIKARVDAEVEPVDGVYAADAEIAALREAVVMGQYSSQLRRVTIAALLGVTVDALPSFTAQPLPVAAIAVPDNVKLDLLARRADINASRWQVEAAQHRMQSAHAEFYPDISVNALAGISSIKFGKLFEAGSAVPSIGGAIHLPIFDAGHLRAQYGVRAAQVNDAINTYNETVVNAAREVSMYATQLQQLAAQRVEREAQREAAGHLLDVATARNDQGLSDPRAKLQASQSLQQQVLSLANLNAAAINAQINLILALGGGYQSDKTAALAAAQ
ncbi:MAG: efflux transporter outer membrane subunit [Steroidobacter sp.]